MKKFRITVKQKNGEEHQATVILDDQTAEALLATGDKELINSYLLDEHKEQLRERAETRRHESLEEDYEKGIDYSTDEVEYGSFLDNISNVNLYNAIVGLTDRQKMLVEMRFVKNMTEEEIAKEFGVTHQAISNSITRLINAIKKNI